jgi:uncharacterized protein YndB with AHSA1/START domain
MSKIKISTTINAPVDQVWQFYTTPTHIVQWNNASTDWHTTSAENDLNVGGKFLYRMEAKDGSEGFDFAGEYTAIDKNTLIKYKMDDGREAEVKFANNEETTNVDITFDAEEGISKEMQQSGWQSILDNFKKYVESQCN